MALFAVCANAGYYDGGYDVHALQDIDHHEEEHHVRHLQLNFLVGNTIFVGLPQIPIQLRRS